MEGPDGRCLSQGSPGGQSRQGRAQRTCSTRTQEPSHRGAPTPVLKINPCSALAWAGPAQAPSPATLGHHPESGRHWTLPTHSTARRPCEANHQLSQSLHLPLSLYSSSSVSFVFLIFKNINQEQRSGNPWPCCTPFMLSRSPWGCPILAWHPPAWLGPWPSSLAPYTSSVVWGPPASGSSVLAGPPVDEHAWALFPEGVAL